MEGDEPVLVAGANCAELQLEITGLCTSAILPIGSGGCGCSCSVHGETCWSIQEEKLVDGCLLKTVAASRRAHPEALYQDARQQVRSAI